MRIYVQDEIDVFGLQRTIQIFVYILRTGGKWLRILPETTIA